MESETFLDMEKEIEMEIEKCRHQNMYEDAYDNNSSDMGVGQSTANQQPMSPMMFENAMNFEVSMTFDSPTQEVPVVFPEEMHFPEPMIFQDPLNLEPTFSEPQSAIPEEKKLDEARALDEDMEEKNAKEIKQIENELVEVMKQLNINKPEFQDAADLNIKLQFVMEHFCELFLTCDTRTINLLRNFEQLKVKFAKAKSLRK